jgi:hypothetical protein
MLADAASADRHLGNGGGDGTRGVGFWYVLNHTHPLNAVYLDSLLAGPKSRLYRDQILGTAWGLSSGSPGRKLKSSEIWESWLSYFNENPAEREKAKRLAELFEQAIAEAEKVKE